MRVKIYSPARTAMQSRPTAGLWVIEPVLPTPRVKEPIRGWTKADDPFSCLRGRLTFATSGEALTFARQRGWDYHLDEPNERRVVPKSYLDNFNPDRRRNGR